MTVYSTGQARLSTILLLAFLLLLICASALAQTRGMGRVVRLKDGGSVKLYEDYQALVIGVGDYEHWPKLPGAVRDAKEVARVLKGLGFKVKLVLDPNSAQLKQLVGKLPYGMGSKVDRGLLIYFAGHGETEVLANRKKLGYIVPIDSPLMTRNPEGFAQSAVSMQDIESLALRIKSRHVLMAFDSCFSGSIFALGRAAPKYITNKVAKPVRQFVTAGNEDEIVPDRSMFKEVFVEGLKGEADHDKDGYITGSELGMYLQKYVVTYTNDAQHPQFGRIRDPALDKGDFVFQLVGGAEAGSDLRVQKIVTLLQEADTLFKSGNLDAPPGANALERYKQVLLFDPLNIRAHAGLKRIINKYADWTARRIKARDYDKAEEYLGRAEQVNEGNPRVMDLRDELRRAKESDAKAERKRKEAERKIALEAERKRKEEAYKARLATERRAKEEAAGKERQKLEAQRRQKATATVVERSSDGQFARHADEVITDTKTSLQWYLGPDRDTDWAGASQWVQGLKVAGGGWRMPSSAELSSLYRASTGSRNMDSILITTGWWVWAGETYGSKAGGFTFWRGRTGKRALSDENKARAFAVREKP